MRLKVIALILFLSLTTIGVKVSAQFFPPAPPANDCKAPYFIPNGCQNPYIPGESRGYTADLNCQLVRITRPGSAGASCCPNICVTAEGEIDTTNGTGNEQNPAVFSQLEVFNTTIKINPNNIGTVINILFTTLLGAVSLYAIVRGIYVTGIKRPMAVTPEQIADLNKELTNLIIGVVICWGFIIIIQVIANLLGVGQLNNLDISGGDSGGTVITIN